MSKDNQKHPREEFLGLLRDFQTTRGLTCPQLAVVLGLHQNTVTRWLSGQTKPGRLSKTRVLRRITQLEDALVREGRMSDTLTLDNIRHAYNPVEMTEQERFVWLLSMCASATNLAYSVLSQGTHRVTTPSVRGFVAGGRTCPQGVLHSLDSRGSLLLSLRMHGELPSMTAEVEYHNQGMVFTEVFDPCEAVVVDICRKVKKWFYPPRKHEYKE